MILNIFFFFFEILNWYLYISVSWCICVSVYGDEHCFVLFICEKKTKKYHYWIMQNKNKIVLLYIVFTIIIWIDFNEKLIIDPMILTWCWWWWLNDWLTLRNVFFMIGNNQHYRCWWLAINWWLHKLNDSSTSEIFQIKKIFLMYFFS